MGIKCTYRIYCSQCNKEQKKKMSWMKYLIYRSTDNKSKGYQEIDGSLIKEEPTKCIFGHPIDPKKTLILFD